MSSDILTEINDYINKNNNSVQKAYHALMNDGYFNDNNIGSYSLGHKLFQLEKIFRELGYNGAKLNVYASDYENKKVFIYWTYDEEKITYEYAKKLTDIWFKNNRELYLSI